MVRRMFYDRRCVECLVGVIGELWLGGEGLARGHLDRRKLPQNDLYQTLLQAHTARDFIGPDNSGTLDSRRNA